MTPRAFDLARLSLSRLLDNIASRTPKSSFAIKSVRESMSNQDDYIAVCDDKQALSLARGIVYNYIGDDLNLYPITAEKKLLRAKALKLLECDIPIEEMTTKDIIYVAASMAEGENYSRPTMRAVYNWFQEVGLDPMQARIYSILFMKGAPMSLKTFPQRDLLSEEYKLAAKELVNMGFIYELPGDIYCVTETTIA